ncbi:MAG: porin [Gammaproteobacteria bacterium]|nr:porin [Gammaproteobacteria bacterium]MCF6260499.1 porin [Gammaproteobacteria bacterium]
MQIIKKNMVALAVAGALVSPLAVMAADAEVSGFIDVIANTDRDPVFTADAEIDVSKEVGAVTVRVDFDMNLAVNGGTTGTDSGRLEQAFFSWAATEQVTILGGLFNSPIGQEAEDAPDLNFTSHSAIWNILDNQTALYGNNLAGVAAAIAAGPATVTLAVVDDLGFATSGTAPDEKGKTSVALVVNAAPMPGLDLELGYVTQDDVNGAGNGTAGDVLDFNAAFKTGPVTLGLDYLTADNVVDNAVNLWVGFEASPEITVKARYETVAFEANGVDDSTKITLHAAYSIEDNLLVALEWSDGETDDTTQDAISGIINDNTTTLEFVGTF